MSGIHVIFKIAFFLIFLLDLTLIGLNFYFSFSLGDALSPISFIELIFPFIGLLAVLLYREESEDGISILCGASHVKAMTVYMIWVVFSLLFTIFLTLVRSGVINLGDGVNQNGFEYIFGQSNGQLDERIFILGFIIIATQAITFPFAAYLRSKMKTNDSAEFKGFA